MEHTKEISTALNTREQLKMTMGALFPWVFTRNPATLHTTKNRSFHAGCLLTSPKHRVPDTWPCTVPVISASKSGPEDRSSNETPWTWLRKRQRSLCSLLKWEKDSYFCWCFAFLNFLDSSESDLRRETQTYRGRDQLPPHLPKYHYPSEDRAWKQEATCRSTLGSHFQHLYLRDHSHFPHRNQITIPPTSIYTQKPMNGRDNEWSQDRQNEVYSLSYAAVLFTPSWERLDIRLQEKSGD